MASPDFDDLNGDDWTRLRAELDAAMDLPRPEAESQLALRLADQPLLLSYAKDMLAMDEENSGETTPLEASRSDGIEVGPYLTRRQIAVGGMGTVYLASRRDGEIQRLVALKIIRPHLETAEVLHRFRRERQVQANLDHPGIVRLLDGGATREGQPYLVMEYVEGKPIDEFCDEQRLSIRERVMLFRKVVDAVNHAHQRLVVHRDLKPSNLLVTAAGEPKLLDFGIAKVLDPEKNSREPEVTGTGMGFLTPGYASPEQVRGSAVTTASDLYSLGVMLYRLLCGRAPYTLEGLTASATERLICEVEPPRVSLALDAERQGTGDTDLSLRATCANRRTSPVELRRELRGDLDAIVAMCLRKEARRRYASASGLGEDIDRYLAGQPVIAQPDSLTYRTGKFIRRNRIAVGFTVASLATLCGGLAYSLHQNSVLRRTGAQLLDQRDLSEKRLVRLRSLRKDVVRAARGIYQRVPAALQEVENLLRTVEHNLSQETDLAADNPGVLAEVAETHLALGRIRYNQRSGNLGLRDQAKESYLLALNALDGANALRPGEPRFVHLYGEILDSLAGILRSHRDQAGALSYYDRLLSICDAVGEEQRDASSVIAVRCLANETMSRIYRAMGRTDRAVERAQEARDDWARLSSEISAVGDIQKGQLAYHDLALGAALIEDGRYDEAHGVLLAAEPVYREIMGDHQGLGPASNWSVFLRKRAAALRGIGAEEAEEFFQQAVTGAELVLQGSPSDYRANSLYYGALYEYVELLVDLGRHSEAEPLAEVVDAQRGKLREAFSADLEANQKRQVETDILFGQLRMTQGDLLDAGEHLEGAQRNLKEMAASGHVDWTVAALGVRVGLLKTELRCRDAERSEGEAQTRARAAAAELLSGVAESLAQAAEEGVVSSMHRQLVAEQLALRARIAAID